MQKFYDNVKNCRVDFIDGMSTRYPSLHHFFIFVIILELFYAIHEQHFYSQ